MAAVYHLCHPVCNPHNGVCPKPAVPRHAPRTGSVLIERLQNRVSSHHPELYKSVLTNKRRAFIAFLHRHPNVFQATPHANPVGMTRGVGALRSGERHIARALGAERALVFQRSLGQTSASPDGVSPAGCPAVLAPSAALLAATGSAPSSSASLDGMAQSTDGGRFHPALRGAALRAPRPCRDCALWRSRHAPNACGEPMPLPPRGDLVRGVASSWDGTTPPRCDSFGGSDT